MKGTESYMKGTKLLVFLSVVRPFCIDPADFADGTLLRFRAARHEIVEPNRTADTQPLSSRCALTRRCVL